MPVAVFPHTRDTRPIMPGLTWARGNPRHADLFRQRARDRDLSHLEGDVACVVRDFHASLYELRVQSNRRLMLDRTH